MFSKNDGVKRREIDTVIGENSRVEGVIHGEASIRIDGRLNGKVMTKGNVVVGKNAVVKADIKAENINLFGEVRGNIESNHLLELGETARFFGDFQTKYIAIAEGAVFEGTSQIKGDKGQNSDEAPQAKGTNDNVEPLRKREKRQAN